MACLDGELTAAESADFESKLTPAQRDRLAAERRFESALGNVLTGDAACPGPVWKRIVREIDAPASSARRGGMRWFYPMAAMAAMVTLVAGAMLFMGNETLPAAFRMEAAHAEALRTTALLRIGSDEASVERYLTDRGIPVHIRNVADFNTISPHPVALLGAGEVAIGGEHLAALLFTCCDKPTRVILAAADSRAGRLLVEAVGREGSDVVEVREFDGYIAGLVSKHRNNEALELLQAKAHHAAALGRSGAGRRAHLF